MAIFGNADVAAGLGDEVRARLVGFRRGDAQLEVKFAGGPDPADGHVARAVADESNDLTGDGAALFLIRENIGDDLCLLYTSDAADE